MRLQNSLRRLKHPYVIAGAVAFAIVLWLVIRNSVVSAMPGLSDLLSNFTTVFLGIFIEASSFLLLGTLASGLVEVFVNQNDIDRFIPVTQARRSRRCIASKASPKHFSSTAPEN